MRAMYRGRETGQGCFSPSTAVPLALTWCAIPYEVDRHGEGGRERKGCETCLFRRAASPRALFSDHGHQHDLHTPVRIVIARLCLLFLCATYREDKRNLGASAFCRGDTLCAGHGVSRQGRLRMAKLGLPHAVVGPPFFSFRFCLAKPNTARTIFSPGVHIVHGPSFCGN